VQLCSKNGANSTAWYPEVAEALAKMPGGPYIIDGEACVLDDLGRSGFHRLQDSARRRRRYPGCDQATLLTLPERAACIPTKPLGLII
jgi:bifunctional non-homologous end joining protein LigD